VPWADGRFATPSGRFIFPDHMDDAEPVLPSEAYPLHLIAQATTESMNSQILEAEQGRTIDRRRLAERRGPRRAGGR
jgi:hypothetical protein